MVLGIIFGIAAVTSGIGLAGMGMLENQQTPQISTTQVCEEYEEPTTVDVSDNPDDRSPEYSAYEDTSHSETSTSEDNSGHGSFGPDCEEYVSYQTGGGSPGNTKVAGGSIVALFGGAIVYRSTR